MKLNKNRLVTTITSKDLEKKVSIDNPENLDYWHRKNLEESTNILNVDRISGSEIKLVGQRHDSRVFSIYLRKRSGTSDGCYFYVSENNRDDYRIRLLEAECQTA